jgi:hypothetical protein
MSARDSRHNRALSRLRLRSQRENQHVPLIPLVIVRESKKRREIIVTVFVIRVGPSTVTYHEHEFALDYGPTGEHNRRYDDRPPTSTPAPLRESAQ